MLANTNIYLLCFFFAILSSCTFSADLPPSYKKCRRSDSDFNACLLGAGQDALPKLANGMKEVRLASIDPLFVPNMVIGEGATGAVRVVQNFKNVNFHGISEGKLKSIKVSFNDKKVVFDIDLVVDNLTMNADYELNGRVLLLPMVGKGKSVVTLRQLGIKINMVCEKVPKNKENYLRVRDVKMKLNPGKVQFDFENLFNGDKQFSEPVLKLINQEWNDVFNDIKPGYEEAFAIITNNISDTIFRQVPYDTLFPV